MNIQSNGGWVGGSFDFDFNMVTLLEIPNKMRNTDHFSFSSIILPVVCVCLAT
jgi:hypothetical protein